MRVYRSSLALLAVAAVGMASYALADPVTEVEGLVAWYEAQALHERVRDGGAVSKWADSSGNGHVLVDQENGFNARLEVARVNERAAVRVREAGSYSVTDPFTLEDHTIFLVHQGPAAAHALFQDGLTGKGGFGVILNGVDGRHGLKTGQQPVAYEANPAPETDFRITVLGREEGRLRGFVNGADRSSDSRLGGPVQVGRFFGLDLTRYVHLDGDGLRVAEMIFYGRYLPDEQRESITRHLGEKYGLEVVQAAPRQPPPSPPLERDDARLWLGTDSTVNLNDPAVVPIEWTVVGKVEPPFRVGEGDEATRLYCTRDGTRARFRVQLPLQTEATGANVRVLVLKNGAEYLPEEGVSGPIAGSAQVDFEARLTMEEGDYVEIVTLGIGEPGVVRLEPGRARVGAED